MMGKLANFNEDTFLAQYWQKQALLVTQAFPQFISPISCDELAGLSLEDSIESRLVFEDERKWLCQHGPFDAETLQSFSSRPFTLLVQAVDHYLEEVAALKNFFGFIPAWRLDDIMISYANQGGSVGPHFDQYDVFLLQAKGNRRWKIGQQCGHDEPIDELSEQAVLKTFEQQEEYILSPGDMLYLPPGLAHWGISESSDCMTISIGFRAPSYEELISEAGHEACLRLNESQRYTDTGNLSSKESSTHQISQQTFKQVKHILADHLLNDDILINSFGMLMTSPKYEAWHEYLEPAGNRVSWRLDSRTAWFLDENTLRVFINGHSFTLEQSYETSLKNLLQKDIIAINELPQKERYIYDQLNKLGAYEDYQG